eukprot:1952220-Amphidinium_carterae.2
MVCKNGGDLDSSAIASSPPFSPSGGAGHAGRASNASLCATQAVAWHDRGKALHDLQLSARPLVEGPPGAPP